MPECIHDAAVVGAGISGLSAARRLAEAGLDVLLLEKSRGPGGRASTRRLELPDGRAASIDHGAQFFTARDPLFRRQAEDWLSRKVCEGWATGFETWDGSRLLPPDPRWEAPRYACRDGMNALGKDLARGLNVRPDCRVGAVSRDERGWRLEPGGERPAVRARALFVSSPIPQSLELIGGFLPPERREGLAKVSYAPCLAVMAVYGKETAPPSWKGIQVRAPGSALSWMAHDSTKRGPRPGPVTVVLHAAPELSAGCGDDAQARERAAARMLKEGARIAGEWLAAPALRTQHRWRYALPAGEAAAAGFERAGGRFPLYLIGDAFQGGRIEGAWLSGRKAAEDLLGPSGALPRSPESLP